MIDFQNVSKGFGAHQVLEGATFRINPGERVGIVGPNGAGKTTVFELIAGESSPDSGQVTIPRGWRLGYVRQMIRPDSSDQTLIEYAEQAVPELHDLDAAIHALERQMPAMDDAARARALRRLGELQTEFEHRGGYTLRSRAESSLGGLGFPRAWLERPFRELSGGWQMRAELAKILVGEPEILLLDEPSNYLDVPAVEWLQRCLREFRGTLVMISHDRYLLTSLTTATIEVFAGTATRYQGGYEYYVRERVRRHEQLLAAHRNQERRREQIERFIERFKSKNTKSSQTASRMKMLERMEEVNVPRELLSPGRIRLARPPHCGREVVRLEGVGFAYEGESWVLRGVDFVLERGEKVALVGLNGTGKTTLLRILAGQLAPREGRRLAGHQVLAGYQSQEFAETLDPALSVYDALKRAAPDMSEREARTLLGSFGFSGDAVEKRVAVLSGGEKIRLAFARLLARPPNLLILDEPTTHLDIAAREALEEALREFEGTVCLVSHDIEFIRHVGATIVEMTPPGITRYNGDFDYYRRKREAADAAAERAVVRPPSAADARRAARRERAERVQELSRLRRPIEREITAAEEAIAALEKEQADLLAQLGGAAAVDYARVSHRLGLIQKELTERTYEWETASLRLEELQESFRSEATGGD